MVLILDVVLVLHTILYTVPYVTLGIIYSISTKCDTNTIYGVDNYSLAID